MKLNQNNACQDSRENRLNTIQEGLGQYQRHAQDFTVTSIDKKQTYDWLLNKHYAKRIPSIIYSFGLFEDNNLIGVCTYGMPPGSTVCESIAGINFCDKVIELNRLCVNDGLPKNALSYFVSQTIKFIKNYNIIISYSDMNMNHNGYIYQACNFIYTGKSINTTRLIDEKGKDFHSRSVGHYKKNNKAKVGYVKKRNDEENINKIEIAKYLRENKGDHTAKKLDKIFGYKDTSAHWFRLDGGFSFPSVDNWLKLKEVLLFDNKHDEIMTSHELVPDTSEIIKKLKLTKIKSKPKHRYIYIFGSKKIKKQILKNLKYKILPYPKNKNKYYDTSYNPKVQQDLFV